MNLHEVSRDYLMDICKYKKCLKYVQQAYGRCGLFEISQSFPASDDQSNSGQVDSKCQLC